MTRILTGLCAALVVAVVVLSILLHLANKRERATSELLAVREAVAQHAANEAARILAAMDAERSIRERLQAEVDALTSNLDSITNNRPIYASRPRPSTAVEARHSILSAVSR